MLRVKNWGDFQHYKDRDPPWIKLHKKLLDDYEYQCLPVASRALAPMLWLLASESKDGSFDGSPQKLAFRLRTTEKEVMAGLKPLIDKGFFVDDSKPLADCKQDAMPEAEAYKPTTEEKALSGKPDAINGFKSDAVEILNYLNSNAGREFRPVPANLTLIAARLKSGVTPLQCREVIFNKCQQWNADPKMAEYLRPKTLFNATNFENYLGELGNG